MGPGEDRHGGRSLPLDTQPHKSRCTDRGEDSKEHQMICNRCGVVNRAGRVACVQCMARLDPASAPSAPPTCTDHPNIPATGQCVHCSKFVCDQCGGVINNRQVYCVEHAAMAMS